MKSNADKCHLLVSTNETVKIKVGNYDITNSKCEKLLGVNFDHKLNLINIFQSCGKRLVEKLMPFQEQHHI